MKIIAILATMTLAGAQGFDGPALKCPDLPAVGFGSEVKIESAKLIPATAKAPEHCDVRGTIWPENQFAVELPTAWNSRFYMVGNGGTAGVISLGAMDNGLRLGYATASTNTGHDAAKEPLATFAKPGPDNPNAERKLIDFGYMAVHETAVLAKKIVKAYYGEAPRYSYWVGCSTGGRQGFSEAQRYPEDFDGLVIGAPAINMSGLNMRNVWNAQAARTGPGVIAVDKLPMLANAVYKICDGADGLEDGLIDDPRRCTFDPARDLPRCPADQDGPNCFTTAQVESLKKIYGGIKTSAGKPVFPGQPPGAEVLAKAAPARPAKSGWDGFIVASDVPLPRGESCLRYMFLNPPPGPEWTYRDFNFDTDPQKTVANSAKVNALNPDLSALKKRGGKIVHYHGWADTSVIPQLSTNYYESVLKTMGAKETREFYKLYMVPGMFHCGGGVGCGTVDWLSPLVAWVEKGTAPGTLIGARAQGGETKRTRPICPYPEVARYKGAGSIDDAGNFSCVTLK
jgi:hypothetical protein